MFSLIILRQVIIASLPLKHQWQNCALTYIEKSHYYQFAVL